MYRALILVVVCLRVGHDVIDGLPVEGANSLVHLDQVGLKSVFNWQDAAARFGGGGGDGTAVVRLTSAEMSEFDVLFR